ncbi:helix-turn-helix domain-containing protein [Lysinibacillus sp. NPDC047702]|uniref:helix-turn-helix domain-containing protein n=1 Tax=unclassified Lysinibacillus TaxID=2636778 RepID=UPI003D05C501
MDINERVRLIRKDLKMNQKEFGKKIVASQNYLSNIENGQNAVTEKIIKIICHEFNVNEEWLRTGEGEMFVQPATFSFDEQIKKSNLSELEVAIMRGYMELDSDVRKAIVQKVESIIQQRSEIVATTVETDIEAEIEAEIEEELDLFRQELRAEKKAQRLSVSQEQDII